MAENSSLKTERKEEIPKEAIPTVYRYGGTTINITFAAASHGNAVEQVRTMLLSTYTTENLPEQYDQSVDKFNVA